MSIPHLNRYISIYGEALVGTAYNRMARSKFSSLSGSPSKLTPEQDRIFLEVTNKLDDFKTEMIAILKQVRIKFKSLDQNSTKLKLVDTRKFKKWSDTLFSDYLSGSMTSNIAEVKWPGEFGVAMENFKQKYMDIHNYYSTTVNILDQVIKDKLPEVYWPEKDFFKSLHLNVESDSNRGGGHARSGVDAIKFGITPINEGGFYRLHATNAPPDFFKSSTKGIGIGKYLYLAVIHHCGQGITTGSSVAANKMWASLIKRKDIYAFMAPKETSNDQLVLAISVNVPASGVLEILDQFCKTFASGWATVLSNHPDKGFLNWLAYRRAMYGDLPQDIIDSDLYVILRPMIDPWVEESNLRRIFPSLPVIAQVRVDPPDPATLPPFERYFSQLISKFADNTNSMNEILISMVPLYRNIMALPEADRRSFPFKLAISASEDSVKNVLRSYYFYMKINGINTESEVRTFLTTLNDYKTFNLDIRYGANDVEIYNAGWVNIKIKHLNMLLKLLYDKYNRNVRIQLNTTYSVYNLTDSITLNRGSYINLSDDPIRSFTLAEIRTAIVTSYPTALPASTRTPTSTRSSYQVPLSNDIYTVGTFQVKFVPRDISQGRVQQVVETYQTTYGSEWSLPSRDDLIYIVGNHTGNEFDGDMFYWADDYMDGVSYRPDGNRGRGETRDDAEENSYIILIRQVPQTVTPPQRSQRRQAGSSDLIRQWISTQGKTRDSILRFLRDFPLSELIRRYKQWLRNTHPGEASMSYVGFRNFILRDYPEVRDVLGR